MATGMLFALAVLAVGSTHLPSAPRAFPPTLAVGDDPGSDALTDGIAAVPPAAAGPIHVRLIRDQSLN